MIIIMLVETTVILHLSLFKANLLEFRKWTPISINTSNIPYVLLLLLLFIIVTIIILNLMSMGPGNRRK